MKSPGQEMYEFAERLWPIPRSITGSGIRETPVFLANIPSGLVETMFTAFEKVSPE